MSMVIAHNSFTFITKTEVRSVISTIISCPTLYKSLGHLTFMRNLHQYLFSLTGRNLKRTFTFTIKGEK